MGALHRFFHKLLHPCQPGTKRSEYERSRNLLARWSCPFAFSSNFDPASSLNTASGKKIRVISFAPILAGSSINQRAGGHVAFR
jgi:hypothetical protein